MGEQIELQLESNLDGPFSILHHNREIAAIDSPGKFKIDLQEVGMGPITLFAVTDFEDRSISSSPIRFQVDP